VLSDSRETTKHAGHKMKERVTWALGMVGSMIELGYGTFGRWKGLSPFTTQIIAGR